MGIKVWIMKGEVERSFHLLEWTRNNLAESGDLLGTNFNKGGNQTLVKESNFKLKKMLQPKRTKYRKVQKGKMKGTLKRA
jgi:hypothetical protein